MSKSRLQFGDSSIEVHHQGAHLCSWLYQGCEQIFVSRKAVFEQAKAIRGGVPICFPQFGAFGPGGHHGFARNLTWNELTTQPPQTLRFELVHNPASLQRWPHEFKAHFEIELELNALSMSLIVENVGAEAMSFTAALHTYFAVSDIEQAVVTGLNGCEYWNNGTDFSLHEYEQSSELRFQEKIDRVYFNTVDAINLKEPAKQRTIESHGFADTVIWNPWRKGADKIEDMDVDEYRSMLCIESANVADPIQLEPTEQWTGKQRISVVG